MGQTLYRFSNMLDTFKNNGPVFSWLEYPAYQREGRVGQTLYRFSNMLDTFKNNDPVFSWLEYPAYQREGRVGKHSTGSLTCLIPSKIMVR